MSDAESVRLLTSDVGGDDGASFIFSEEEIGAFLELEPRPYRAAALALRTLAANEALVQKRITYLGLSTNGADTARALLEAANGLEERDDATADDDAIPEFANFGDSMFTRRNMRLGLEDLE